MRRFGHVVKQSDCTVRDVCGWWVRTGFSSSLACPEKSLFMDHVPVEERALAALESDMLRSRALPEPERVRGARVRSSVVAKADLRLEATGGAAGGKGSSALKLSATLLGALLRVAPEKESRSR